MSMTSRERLLTVLKGGVPDRLPVTTHHVIPYFLDKYMNGIDKEEFFNYFGFDGIVWTVPHRPDKNKNEYYDPNQNEPGFLESRRIINDSWQIQLEEMENKEFSVTKYSFSG